MTHADLPPAPQRVAISPLGPFAEARAGMQGRYLLRSARSVQAIRWIDRALSLIPKRRPPLPERFERILLANWGHLGDVVTTYGVIRALRDRHPGIEIGMIVAASGRAAIEKTGLVDRLHVVDHFWLSRKEVPFREKHRHFRETRGDAMPGIRAAGYQAGIDLFPFFPPAHPLFYKAGIPIRVGFSSGGFGPLLTHPVRWPDAKLPIAVQYGALLDALHPDAPFPRDVLRPRYDRTRLAPLPAAVADLGRYLVLHPGAGAAYKEWGIGHWRDLAARLLADSPGRRLVVTGAGASECAMAAEIAALSPTILDMAGKVDWEGFVSIVAHADIVICPDTATGHVAAALDVPVVSIFTGTNVAEQWQPHTAHGRLLLNQVLCAPCHRAGCEVMGCIRAIPPEAVLAAMCDLNMVRAD